MSFRKLMATALIGTMCLAGVACSKTLPSETTPSAVITSSSAPASTQDTWYRATNFSISNIAFEGAELKTTKDGDILPQVALGSPVKFTVTSPTITQDYVEGVMVQAITFTADGVAENLMGLQTSDYTVTLSEDGQTLTIQVNADVVPADKTTAYTMSLVNSAGTSGVIAVVIVGDATQVSFQAAVEGGTSESASSTVESSGEASETSVASESETSEETTETT